MKDLQNGFVEVAWSYALENVVVSWLISHSRSRNKFDIQLYFSQHIDLCCQDLGFKAFCSVLMSRLKSVASHDASNIYFCLKNNYAAFIHRVLQLFHMPICSSNIKRIPVSFFLCRLELTYTFKRLQLFWCPPPPTSALPCPTGPPCFVQQDVHLFCTSSLFTRSTPANTSFLHIKSTQHPQWLSKRPYIFGVSIMSCFSNVLWMWNVLKILLFIDAYHWFGTPLSCTTQIH